MSKIFHHHPDGLIILQAEGFRYMDTVENFTLDYSQPYAGLPENIKEFRHVEGGASYYITDKGVQIASDMDMAFVRGAVENLQNILNNQQRRLAEIPVEPDPDADKWRANDETLKQIASGLGIETNTTLWRDDLLVKLAQRVFSDSKR